MPIRFCTILIAIWQVLKTRKLRYLTNFRNTVNERDKEEQFYFIIFENDYVSLQKGFGLIL